MKKITSLILALVLTFSLVALSACGSKTTNDKSTASADDKVITVGASATPHAEILEQVKQALADEGYELKIVTYDDYVLPNQALADGTLDANYFQHKPYLDSFNAKNGTNLVSVGTIHYEPFGIYGNGVTDLKDLAKGATIIIPADDSNETRALFLLQQEGLIKLPDDADAAKGVSTLDIVDDGGYNITLKEDVGLEPTKLDIAENPHNYEIVEMEAAQLPRSLGSLDIAVINGNYALAAGLKISDALATEDANGTAAQTYANIIAVRAGDENSPKTQALLKALKTDAVKQYIADTYNGAVVASF